MVVSQVDRHQIKKLEIKGSRKRHRVKHMHSPMSLNYHLAILGGRTTVQLSTSMLVQILAIGQTKAVRNQQKNIKAMQRKSAAMI